MVFRKDTKKGSSAANTLYKRLCYEKIPYAMQDWGKTNLLLI